MVVSVGLACWVAVGWLWRRPGSPGEGCDSKTDLGLQCHLRGAPLVMQPLHAPKIRYVRFICETPMVSGQ